MTQTQTRRPRRSPEQIVAALKAKLELQQAKADKAKRAAETRVKIMLGGYVRAAADGGDRAAADLVDRWRRSLKPQDLDLVSKILDAPRPKPKVKPETPVIDEAALKRSIDDAAMANGVAVKAGDKPEIQRTYATWREAIAAYETATKKWFLNPEDRTKHKFGGLGELL